MVRITNKKPQGRPYRARQRSASNIGVGTAGVNRSQQRDEVLARSAAGDMFGARARIEFNRENIAHSDDVLTQVFGAAPATADALHVSAGYGLNNESPSDVRLREPLLRPEVRKVVERFDQMHRRAQANDQMAGINYGGSQAGVIIIDASGGGHQEISLWAVEEVARVNPRAMIVVSFPIPQEVKIRQHAPETLERLLNSSADLVIVQDDRVNQSLQDQAYAHGSAGLLGGFTSSNKIGQLAANNLLKSLCASGSKGMLVVQEAYAVELPATRIFSDSRLGPVWDVYSVGADMLQMEVFDGLRLMQQESRRNSLGLNLNDVQMTDTARLRVVSSSVRRRDLEHLSDEILGSLEVIGPRDFGVEWVFLNTHRPAPFDPNLATCELVVTELRAVADGRSAGPILDQLFTSRAGTAPSELTDERGVAAPVASKEPVAPTPHTRSNGHGYGRQALTINTKTTLRRQ